MKLSSLQKKWLVSSLITFVTGFGMVLLSEIDNLTMASFSDGTYVGVLFLAVRTGVKAVLEYLLAK